MTHGWSAEKGSDNDQPPFFRKFHGRKASGLPKVASPQKAGLDEGQGLRRCWPSKMLCPTGMLNWQISPPAAAQALHAEQRANAFFVSNRRMPNQIHVFFCKMARKSREFWCACLRLRWSNCHNGAKPIIRARVSKCCTALPDLFRSPACPWRPLCLSPAGLP